MESRPQAINYDAKHLNYECNSGTIWTKSLDEEDLLFKYYDPAIKEEKDVKKIKDEQIFTKTSQTQKIIKFTSLKQKARKETSAQNPMDTDTPVFVTSHNQYGIIRKVIKAQQQQQIIVDTSFQTQIQYEVRLSTSLENVIVEPSDLKRMISVQMRLHSSKAGESQIVHIHVKLDSSIQQLL